MQITQGALLIGAAGTAIEVLYTPEPVDKPDWAASVAAWFFECRGQSPGWRHYVLSVVHLRPFEGQTREPFLRFDGATHEFILTALDPNARPDAMDPTTWRRLTPMNLVHQIAVPSDGAARRIADHAARRIADDRLWAEPPLSGQTEPWVTILDTLAARARDEDTPQ